MLTPDYYSNCADEIVNLYSKLDERITKDIVRRILKTGKITDSAKWQIEMAQQSGMLYDDVIDAVEDLTGYSKEYVKDLFYQSGSESIEFDNKIYAAAGKKTKTLQFSPSALRILQAGILKTNGLLYNLTRTTALSSQNIYIDACSIAEMEVTSGAFSYQQAICHAIRDAVEQSIKITYPSGHTDKLDVAVRRSVMTGVSQTTGEISVAYAAEMGTDLMQVTAHGGARPSHEEWQGKIVSITGKTKRYRSAESIGYKTGAGFKGWNCRHDWYPYFPGISSKLYSQSDLDELKSKTVTYNGKEMTQYDAEQRQRDIERMIRKDKCKLVGYNEALKIADNPDIKTEFEIASSTLKKHEALYKDFSYKTDLPLQNDRTQKYGFNRSVSQKAIAANRRHNK